MKTVKNFDTQNEIPYDEKSGRLTDCQIFPNPRQSDVSEPINANEIAVALR